MSLTEELLCTEPRFEIEALQHLRLYRAERAERALQKAQVSLRALAVQIEKAHTVVERARLYEIQQRDELVSRYQGQVVSPRDLTNWRAQECKVSAATAREDGVLQSLFEQQRLGVAQVESARKQATACQRQVEKLRELSALLAEQGI